MVEIALLGEEPRVRTFGATTYGATTANRVYDMPDGSTMLLSVARYAVGDKPVFRGGIVPMEPAGAGESAQAVVQRAANWAAANSPLCKGAPSRP